MSEFHERHFGICPDCGKKGVHLILRPNISDGATVHNYDSRHCRYCGWEAYTTDKGPHSQPDERARFRAAQGAQVFPVPREVPE